jgi:DNA-binding NarL/FixJ family response regulator
MVAAARSAHAAGMHPARVLLVDDDSRFRALTRMLLEARGCEIVAEAQNGSEAIAATGRVHPDAALVDVQLPDTDGFALARELAAVDTGLRILLTSTDRTLATRAVVADSGAVAFVPKDLLAVTDLAPWLGS